MFLQKVSFYCHFKRRKRNCWNARIQKFFLKIGNKTIGFWVRLFNSITCSISIRISREVYFFFWVNKFKILGSSTARKRKRLCKFEVCSTLCSLFQLARKGSVCCLRLELTERHRTAASYALETHTCKIDEINCIWANQKFGKTKLNSNSDGNIFCW